jgi:ribulose-phosphate 3-epimerase
MDGQFVPPISFGPAICHAARRATALPLDVHLMIIQPARYFEELAGLGVGTVSVHVEACPHLHRDLGAIKALGMRAGVALNPGTPLAALEAVLELADVVLVMSVNPGWGGQPFLPSSVHRIERLAAWLVELGRPETEIEVDGGVNAATAPMVVRAGATVLVAGSAAFGHPRGVAAGLSEINDALGRAT